MTRSDTYVCHVDMLNGSPVGAGAERLAKVREAMKATGGMMKRKYRLRITARGGRGVTLKTCTLAAVYLYRIK